MVPCQTKWCQTKWFAIKFWRNVTRPVYDDGYSKKTLNPDVILRIARALKASDRQAQQIEYANISKCKTEKSFQYVIQPRSDTNQEFRPNPPADNQQHQNPLSDEWLSIRRVCYCCGRNGHRTQDTSCSTNNKTCNKWGKMDILVVVLV